MSTFGARLAYASRIIEREMADPWDYVPMREVVNGEPVEDTTRATGRVDTAIILQPGASLGSGWSLNAMHQRASSEPTLYFRARGLLSDVRRFDRFWLRSTYDNVDRTGTRFYEVADGPRPIGFGWYRSGLVEIVVGPVMPVLIRNDPGRQAIGVDAGPDAADRPAR